MKTNHSLKTWSMMVACTLALGACGGGGGASADPAAVVTQPAAAPGAPAEGGTPSDSAPSANDSVARFAGSYAGEIGGDDLGTLSLTISDQGEVSGSASTTVAGKFAVNGSAGADGAVSLSVGELDYGVTMVGTIATDTDPWTIRGTWHNMLWGASGTFTLTRQ